jgi:hypothetical protein
MLPQFRCLSNTKIKKTYSLKSGAFYSSTFYFPKLPVLMP